MTPIQGKQLIELLALVRGQMNPAAEEQPTEALDQVAHRPPCEKLSHMNFRTGEKARVRWGTQQRREPCSRGKSAAHM